MQRNWNQSWLLITAFRGNILNSDEGRLTLRQVNGLTPDQSEQLQRKSDLGKRRGREEDRQKLRSLSKSRKKFGPCSSSVQVSTFNRFPIWLLQEREKEKERRKSTREVKVIWETADQSRYSSRSGPGEEWQEENSRGVRGRRHGFVIKSRGPRREKEQQSGLHLFLHLLFHSAATLTFKVQEKVWIVLYFPC